MSVSGLLGLGSSLLNKQTPSTGAPDLGLSIPGISQGQGILSNNQTESSSFGKLLSSGPQATSSNSSPQTFQQAAQSSMQNLGAQNSAANSPFGGGVGRVGANGGSGASFSGSLPTPFEALSQGQMTQPNQQPQSSGMNIDPASFGRGSLLGEGLGGVPAVGNVPGMSPIGQPVPGSGGAVGSSGVTSPMAPVSGNPQEAQKAPAGGKPASMKIVDPDYNTAIAVGPQAPSKATTITDPDYGTPIQVGRQAMEPTPKSGFNVQRDIVEPTGNFVKKNIVDPFAQGAKQSMVNIGDSLLSPTGAVAQKDREGVQRLLNEEETALARRNADHPYLSGAAKVAGELAPYLLGGAALKATGVAIKGTSALARAAQGSVFNGIVGATQYAATQVDRAVNTGIGMLFGGVAGSAAPLVSKLGATSASAIAGGIGGYQASKGDLSFDTAWKTAGGAVGGAATGKFGKAVIDLAAKKGSKPALWDDAVKKDSWHAANPAFDKTLFKTAAEQKAALKDKFLKDGKVPEEFGQPHPKARLWEIEHNLPNNMTAAERTRALAYGKARDAAIDKLTGKKSSLIDNAYVNTPLKGAAMVGTQEGTQAINSKNTPVASSGAPVVDVDNLPTDNNAAMLQKSEAILAKNQTTPLIEAVSPEVKAQIAKTKWGSAMAQDILQRSPKEIEAMISNKKGRDKLLKVVQYANGKEAAEELAATFRERDGASPGSTNIVRPDEAVMEKIRQIDAKKGDSKAAIKQKVQEFQTKQVAEGKPKVEINETTIERMGRELNEKRTRSRALRERFGIGGGAQKKAKSAFSYQLIRLLLSYMMKQPSVKGMLNAPGEQGAAARLVAQRLGQKASGG